MNKPHGENLRANRSSMLGHYYHLIFTTADRARIFSNFYAAQIMCKQLFSFDRKKAQTIAFVVMPDHVHWLMQLDGELDLAGCMQRIKGTSAREINKLSTIKTKVWQPGYYDHMLRDDEDLRATVRYIVANPVRANIVEKVGDYPFWNAVWL